MLVSEKFPNYMKYDNYGGIISNLVFPFWYQNENYLILYNNDAFKIGDIDWCSELDITFAFKYNNRELRPMVSALEFRDGSSSDDPTETQQMNAELLAKMINARYADKWNKIYEALAITYKPLENYNRHEEWDSDVDTDYNESGGNTNNRTFADDSGTDYKVTKEYLGGYKDTDDTSKTESGTLNKVTKNEQAHSVFGFDNSSEFGSFPKDESGSTSGSITTPGSPSTADSSVTSEKNDFGSGDKAHKYSNAGGITRQYGISNVNDGKYQETEQTEGGITDSVSHNKSGGTDTHTNYTGDISGNIGVTTSQQMLEQELEVRKHLFYDMVIDDIASVLTLSIY